MGLNSRKPLDPRWTTHHISVPVGFMEARVRVIRKLPNSPRAYDQTTGTWNLDGFVLVFVGLARIQPYGIIGDQLVAQDATGRRLMRVQVKDKTTGIELDDMLLIDSAPDNPELTGYALEIRGAIGSSNAWVTDLVCEADLKRGPMAGTSTAVFPMLYPGGTANTYKDEAIGTSDLGLQWSTIVPLATWNIPIPATFNRIPSVTVYDSAGDTVQPDVNINSARTMVTLTFSAPTTGTALLN